MGHAPRQREQLQDRSRQALALCRLHGTVQFPHLQERRGGTAAARQPAPRVRALLQPRPHRRRPPDPAVHQGLCRRHPRHSCGVQGRHHQPAAPYLCQGHHEHVGVQQPACRHLQDHPHRRRQERQQRTRQGTLLHRRGIRAAVCQPRAVRVQGAARQVQS